MALGNDRGAIDSIAKVDVGNNRGNVDSVVKVDVSNSLNVLDNDLDDTPVFATADENGWIKIPGVLDSGDVQSVAPPHLAPGVPIVPSAGSRRGQHFRAANGHKLPNLEQHISLVTDQGGRADVTFPVTGVTKPLLSVGELCDRGEQSHFRRRGWLYS